MIDCIYYENLRCFRNGTIERQFKNGKWREIAPYQMNRGYLVIFVAGKSRLIHRLIAFCFLGLEDLEGNHHNNQIDHRNHNRSDNRIENLRIVTAQQNNFNSNAKGCSFNKNRQRWGAYITLNRKRIFLGYFETEEEAHQNYLEAKEKYHIL